MLRTTEQDRVGRWMRWAARLAGLTAEQIRREMGLKAEESVYKWWAGLRQPTPANMTAYAAVTGKPRGYFYQDQDPPEMARSQVEALSLVAELFLQGATEDEAFAAAVRKAPRLSEEERKALREALSEFKALLAGAAPPPPGRWSEAERRKLLDELAEIVLARRSPPPG